MTLASRAGRFAPYLLLLAFALGWCAVSGTIRLRSAHDSPPAEGLRIADLEGRPVDLAARRGRIVVVNLWATWCPPCRREIPALAAIAREYGGRGVEVLGVSTDELAPAELARRAAELGVTYELATPLAPPAGSFRTSGTIPHTWIVDREGRVRASHVGIVSRRALSAVLDRMLAEPSGEAP